MSERFRHWLDGAISEIVAEAAGDHDTRAIRAIRVADAIRAEAVRQGFAWDEIEGEEEQIAIKVDTLDQSFRGIHVGGFDGGGGRDGGGA